MIERRSTLSASPFFYYDCFYYQDIVELDMVE